MVIKRLGKIYNQMKRRCYNSICKDYKYYGAKGVTVCDEWKNNPKLFYEWALSHGYQDHLTIDRIDTNGNYCPDNCRWVTLKVQANNKSNTQMLTYNGKTQGCALWCEELNLDYYKIKARLRNGWSVKQAFENRENAEEKIITYNGKSKNIHDWSKELNINYDTLCSRLYRGWSVERAFTTPTKR